MNLQDQQRSLRDFHSRCLDIIRSKGPDYAPEGIPLLDMLATCVDANISIPQGLWALYRKHISAIRKHFILGQPLTSEPITDRLADAANYLGFLAFYETHKRELFAAWQQHWMAQPCECKSVNNVKMICQRCETLRWLGKTAVNDAYGQTW